MSLDVGGSEPQPGGAFLQHYDDRNGDPHQFVPVGDLGYLTEWHGGLDVTDLSDPMALDA